MCRLCAQHPDVALLQSVADIVIVYCNLPPHTEGVLADVLSDWLDLHGQQAKPVMTFYPHR